MSATLFGSPWAALKNWATVTPWLRRTNVGPPAGSPVTVDTTLTPPDCSVPPTVIVFPFIFTVITGRAARCPVWAAGAVWAARAVPPGMARDRPATATAAVMLLRIADPPFRVLLPPAGRRLRGRSRLAVGPCGPGLAGYWPGGLDDLLPGHGRLVRRALAAGPGSDAQDAQVVDPVAADPGVLASAA